MFLSRKSLFTRAAAVTGLVFAAFLFICCTMDESDDFVDDGKLDLRLIGTWIGDYDTYIITEENHLTYDDDGWFPFAGEIVHVVNFSKTSGVLIIKYDEGKEQPTTPPDNYFYGIYFRNLTDNSVIFSNTSDMKNDWGPSETATKEEAINRFKLDNMTDWISFDAGATPHSKE